LGSPSDPRLVLCVIIDAVRYEYDGNDVYRLMAEEDGRGRIVALLIWVRNLFVSQTSCRFNV